MFNALTSTTPASARIAQALGRAPQDPLDPKLVDSYKRGHRWEVMSEKARWSLRDAVYQEAKSYGCNKQILRAALEDVLPVSREVAAKRKAQKQAMHDLAGGIKDLKIAVADEFKALQAQTTQASQSSQAAAFMLELQGMRDQCAEDFEKQKAQLAQAAADLNREIESQTQVLDAGRVALTRDLKLLKQLKFQDEETAKKIVLFTRPSDDLIKIEVGTELFQIPSAQIKEKKGFLNELFFGGFEDSRDEDGIFHWQFPYVSAADFNYVAQYYMGNLPHFISEETGARLNPLAQYLGLDAMVVTLKARSQLAEPEWEVEFTSHNFWKEGRAEAFKTPQGRGWKPFASSSHANNYGETHLISWRRQKPSSDAIGRPDAPSKP